MEGNKIDYNALGQAIDTTWGRSSTPKTAGYSVKMSMHGDTLIVNYGVIVNFGSEKEMIVMKRSYAEESTSMIDAVLKSVKETYKKLSGKSLKTSQMTTGESLEIIGFAVHNPKRTAYYRRKTVFELK